MLTKKKINGQTKIKIQNQRLTLKISVMVSFKFTLCNTTSNYTNDMVHTQHQGTKSQTEKKFETEQNYLLQLLKLIEIMEINLVMTTEKRKCTKWRRKKKTEKDRQRDKVKWSEKKVWKNARHFVSLYDTKVHWNK